MYLKLFIVFIVVVILFGVEFFIFNFVKFNLLKVLVYCKSFVVVCFLFFFCLYLFMVIRVSKFKIIDIIF